MNKKAVKLKGNVQAQSDIKEQECVKATDLSANLNEAVEKSLAKSSADEAKPSAR